MVNVARSLPSLGRTLPKLLILLPLVHQILVPSKRMETPPPEVPGRWAPSLARTFSRPNGVVIQMLAPSKAMDEGPEDRVAKVPSTAPSLGRILITLSFCLERVTQTLLPSKITPELEPPPRLKLVVRLAGYQCRMAICWGFLVELATPP